MTLSSAASTRPDPEEFICGRCDTLTKWVNGVNVCLDAGDPASESENAGRRDIDTAMRGAAVYELVCRVCARTEPLEPEWRTAEMTCPICSFAWIASYPAAAKQLECKECGHMVAAPEAPQ